MRKALTLISGPVLAVFFLWLAFRNVELSALVDHIRQASVPLLMVAAATVVVHLLLRALRWRTFLGSVRPRPPFRELFSAVSIGYMASLLPGRVGELLRPALLARRTGVPFAPALATVGVERVVFDLLAILVIGAIALVLPLEISGLVRVSDPKALATMRSAGVISLAVGLALLVVFAAVGRHEQRVAQWVEARAAGCRGPFAAKTLRWFGSLLPGFAALATTRGLIRLSLETVLIWGVIALGIHAGIAACGVELAPAAGLLMLPILALGIAVPTPGGAGSYHAAMIFGLTKLFGTPTDAAASAAIVVHALTWLPVLALGGFFMARGGLSATAPAPLAGSEAS